MSTAERKKNVPRRFSPYTGRALAGKASRITASFSSSSSSSSSSQPQRETITLTTDYESLPAAVTPLTIHVVSSTNRHNVAVSTAPDTPPPTLSFYNYYRRPRSLLPRLRAAVPCCRGQGDDELRQNERAPPTYSALYPASANDDDDHRPVLLGGRGACDSFVARAPPPSYAQAQGICVAYSIQQLISNSGSDGRMWSPRSTTAVCPRCATLVITVVEVQQTPATHVTALALFLMGCWPCCMLPYCIDSCKKSHHYCPFCRTYLGTYMPW